MAFRDRLLCFVCNRLNRVALLARINRDEEAAKREIAIRRREEFNRPPLLINNRTRICLNCNRSVQEELLLIERDPACLRSNVLTQI